jgi:hypothetical protein
MAVDDGLGRNCEGMIERKPTRRSPRLCLRGPEQREIGSFGQGLGGELGWLVTRGDRFDNFRGQERQPQQSSDVAGTDALEFRLALYLVVKGVEILHIALAPNREKRVGIIAIGVLMQIPCIVEAGGFVKMQDQQVTSVSSATRPSL